MVHEHGHESAKHGKEGEWLGPKLKQFLKASGLTVFMSTVIFSALAIPVIPAYIAAQGLAGGGLSIWGWNSGQKKESHGGHGSHASHGGGK